jgi:hypothetical protein
MKDLSFSSCYIRIAADHIFNPRVPSHPDRIIGLAVPCTAFAADKMPGYLGHQGTGMRLASRKISGSTYGCRSGRQLLQWTSSSFPSLIRSPIVTGLERNGCDLRRLLALLRWLSSSTSSGSLEISFECGVPRHWSGGCRKRQLPIRLAIDMGHAVGIDNPVFTGHRLHRPGLGEAARRHARGSSVVGRAKY